MQKYCKLFCIVVCKYKIKEMCLTFPGGNFVLSFSFPQFLDYSHEGHREMRVFRQ